MAGRPKKTIDTIEKTDDARTNEITVDASISASSENPIKEEYSLEKENNKLKAQLKDVLDKLANMEKKSEMSKTASTNTIFEEDNYKDINPLKPIKVVSLTDGGVSLRTSASGSGKTFRFDKFGHPISITYSDIQDIIATDRTFIEDGMVYICDKDVVKNNYLDEYYKKFLTVETITNILTFDKDDIFDMVSNTTEPIQETIISLLIKKINSNEYVDMNKVDIIGKSCVSPCDISALALQKRAN